MQFYTIQHYTDCCYSCGMAQCAVCCVECLCNGGVQTETCSQHKYGDSPLSEAHTNSGMPSEAPVQAVYHTAVLPAACRNKAVLRACNMLCMYLRLHRQHFYKRVHCCWRQCQHTKQKTVTSSLFLTLVPLVLPKSPIPVYITDTNAILSDLQLQARRHARTHCRHTVDCCLQDTGCSSILHKGLVSLAEFVLRTWLEAGIVRPFDKMRWNVCVGKCVRECARASLQTARFVCGTDRQTLAQLRPVQSGMIPYDVTCLLIAHHTRVMLMKVQAVEVARVGKL